MTAVGFTGTHLGMTPKQLAGVRIVARKLKPDTVHHGDCVGGDEQFHHIIHRRHAAHIFVHPPEDSRNRAWCGTSEVGACCSCSRTTVLPVKPYIPRNHDIVDDSEVMIAAPQGPEKRNPRSGTWATIRYARKQHKTVHLVWPDGSIDVLEG